MMSLRTRVGLSLRAFRNLQEFDHIQPSFVSLELLEAIVLVPVVTFDRPVYIVRWRSRRNGGV